MKNFNRFLWKINVPIEKNPRKQLLDFITARILEGGLGLDDQLPSIRNFAKLNHLNITTVKRVYSELSIQGLICTVPGKGTFVTSEAETYRSKNENSSFLVKMPIPLPQTLPDVAEPKCAETDFLSIGFDTLNPYFTPFAQLSKHYRAHQDSYRRYNQDEQVRDLQGLELMEAVRKYLKGVRGFPLQPGCLRIVFSRKTALRLLFRSLLRPGAAIVNTCPLDVELAEVIREMELCEHVFRTPDPRFLENLEELLLNHSIQLLIVRPQCGFPDGSCLDTHACEGLVMLAKQYQFYILEEDPYHEFWHEALPFRPLSNCNHEGHVVYLGILSQLSVYMRNLYIICACQELIDQISGYDKGDYAHRDPILELAIADLINSGKLWDMVQEARKQKKREKEDLAYILETVLGDYLRIAPAPAGLTLWISFPEDLDLAEIIKSLSKKIGVPYHPAMPVPYKKCHKMRLGFGTYNKTAVIDAAKALIKLLNTDRD